MSFEVGDLVRVVVVKPRQDWFPPFFAIIRARFLHTCRVEFIESGISFDNQNYNQLRHAVMSFVGPVTCGRDEERR